MYLFQGRLNRTDYAIGSGILLVTCIVLLGFGFVVIGLPFDQLVFHPLFMLTVGIALLGTISLSVRRLHDMDLSGWWCLLQFVSIINFIFGIYLFAKAGTESENKYGQPQSLKSSVMKIFWD